MNFPSSHPALARALAQRGYEEATAVQAAVLQDDAANRDLVVSAQTGSGKTVAFGLAIAPTLLAGEEERFGAAGAPLALVVAPTRELALQVQRELVWLYAETGARIVTCVGGMDVRGEARQLAAGAHIVVGTPGRLRDHLERKRLDLGQLKSVVLDEADEMLDLGFRDDLEFILEMTPAERRTLLFSATMPREIENLARRYQRDALRIQTVRRDEQHADIEYTAMRVAAHEVENAVVNVLRFHEMRGTLVFCATREAVKRMHARLVERGFSAVALSGELSQAERNSALQSLRNGRSRVLVATDVAARGLDLPDLSLVIHAELPNDAETLVHRSGRTGRAGKKGLCVLIVAHNRRRKAETLLGNARLKVTWAPPPTAAEIRARDQERFYSDAIFTDPPSEEEMALAAKLQEARNSKEIAVALVRMHGAGLPAPEDISADTGGYRRDDRPASRQDRPRPQDRERTRAPQRERDFDRDRAPRPPREASHGPRRAADSDSGDMVWFRINIGRERNADPRWLLPLICRAGDVSKAEIGAIRVFDRDTRFQIRAVAADQFAHAVRLNPEKEGNITRLSKDADAQPAREARGGDREQHDRREQTGRREPSEQRSEPRSEPRREPRPHRKGNRHGAQGPAGQPARQGEGFEPRKRSKYAAKKKWRDDQGQGEQS